MPDKYGIVNFEVKVKETTEKAVEEAARATYFTAKTYCRVDTGLLRSSIAMRGSGLRYEVGSPVHYARFQDKGLGGAWGNVYLRRAANVAEAALVNKML